jgi:SAM-dependent methyltransferase
VDVHGEAALVDELVPRSTAVLDGGCGTGRVAIELTRRGHEVVGVDLDPGMLGKARAKAPELAWVQADLATLDLGRSFDAVVLAGNVLLFVVAGSEGAVVARAAAHLRPGGLLLAGFQCTNTGYGPDALDHHAAAAGLTLEARWSTWDRRPWTPAADYQVSVHRREAVAPTGKAGSAC